MNASPSEACHEIFYAPWFEVLCRWSSYTHPQQAPHHATKLVRITFNKLEVFSDGIVLVDAWPIFYIQALLHSTAQHNKSISHAHPKRTLSRCSKVHKHFQFTEIVMW